MATDVVMATVVVMATDVVVCCVRRSRSTGIERPVTSTINTVCTGHKLSSQQSSVIAACTASPASLICVLLDVRWLRRQAEFLRCVITTNIGQRRSVTIATLYQRMTLLTLVLGWFAHPLTGLVSRTVQAQHTTTFQQIRKLENCSKPFYKFGVCSDVVWQEQINKLGYMTKLHVAVNVCTNCIFKRLTLR